jgi:tripartite motif-containing protein 71
MAHIFVLALGLLKPRPDKQNHTTPIQRASENKLLDLNILRVIRKYIEPPFYFTSQDVAVQHRIAFTGGVSDIVLSYPNHLCELSDGCIAVAEYRKRGLIRIFRDDVLVQSIGHGIVSCPFGICTNSKNHLIVTDDNKHQVHVFDRDGSHIRSFSSKGNDDGLLNDPGGVCVNSKGHIIVVNRCNHRVSMFDNDGKFVRTIGSHGSDNGQLNYPVGICVDRYDNMYVAEYHNNRVSKFSSDGKFICKFGSRGRNLGQISGAWDVCVDREGKYIVVAEWNNDRLQVLSGLNGSFIASYGILYLPILFASGCCVTSDGRILVSDFSNNTVHEISKV